METKLTLVTCYQAVVASCLYLQWLQVYQTIRVSNTCLQGENRKQEKEEGEEQQAQIEPEDIKLLEGIIDP